MRPVVRNVVDGAVSMLRRVYLDVDADPARTIFLAGTGRSGSSWVANIINYRNDYRCMFEPFFPQRVPQCRRFAYRQYLRPGDENPVYLDPARTVVTGRIRSSWVDQFNHKLIASQRIIKDIRANLLLCWLKRAFPALRVVLVLRHPCADAASRLALGWRSHLDDLTAQPDLVADHLAPFADVLRSASTDFERHVVLWCIENLVPLRQFAPGELHVAFYEHLCMTPVPEVRRLFAFLRVDYDEPVLSHLRQPTALAREEGAAVRGGSLVDGWRSEVPAKAAARALAIVRAFGLGAIYGDASMPDVDAAYALLAAKDSASAWTA